ncbi:hypothetical protein EDD85DRAFT_792807 [Armillaria nabsnona]|nr:hypothetical protein EDD85DRAFT_792807 [Armillaria nabsnona]
MQLIDGKYLLSENLAINLSPVTVLAYTRDKQEVFQPAPQATSPSKIRNANSHLLVPSLTSRFTTRLKKIRNTNQYEVTSIPAIVPPPAPPPDAFPRFNAEASTVLQEFEDFLEGKVPSDYVKSLLGRYFKDNSRRQGEIGIFVEPLDDLYRMQTAYKDISVKALQADGPSKRQKKMECAGEKIGQLISWLEDIWRVAIDGPYGLRVAYNNHRLKWQREAKIKASSRLLYFSLKAAGLIITSKSISSNQPTNAWTGPSTMQSRLISFPTPVNRIVEGTAVAFRTIDGDSSLVLLVDGVGITFGTTPPGRIGIHRANNIARLYPLAHPSETVKENPVEAKSYYKGQSAKIRSDYPSTFEAASKMSRSSRVGITEEQRIFLEPYITYYGRLKANARERPKPYSVFQLQLWLLWKDRFRAQLQLPNPTDPDACRHWYACRQKDLVAIIRTLEMWQPFYAAGRKRELAQRVKVRAKVAKAAKAAAQTRSDEQKDGEAGV